MCKKTSIVWYWPSCLATYLNLKVDLPEGVLISQRCVQQPPPSANRSVVASSAPLASYLTTYSSIFRASLSASCLWHSVIHQPLVIAAVSKPAHNRSSSR